MVISESFDFALRKSSLLVCNSRQRYYMSLLLPTSLLLAVLLRVTFEGVTHLWARDTWCDRHLL